MVAWRMARSLETLRLQLNNIAPNRSKVSDGGIGDAAHLSRGSGSDHNPRQIPGLTSNIVTARDFTHDPAGGLDGQRLANALIASRDPRIKYVIWNRQICDMRPRFHPGQWLPYTGTNPHQHHVHLSVMDNLSCDDTRPWYLPGLTAPVGWINVEDSMVPVLREGDGQGRGDRARLRWYVMSAQALLNVRGLDGQVAVDGQFGPATSALVRKLQARAGLPQSGVIDAATWTPLLGNDAPELAA